MTWSLTFPTLNSFTNLAEPGHLIKTDVLETMSDLQLPDA